METSWCQEGGPMSICDPITATRVGVGIGIKMRPCYRLTWSEIPILEEFAFVPMQWSSGTSLIAHGESTT